ncbi:exodeoxyribonuclease V subunit alpha [Ferrimonas sediminicola]|uniref:RecBCD enzyme subunit RecD n=1 Tax=Ferrimonas sediminicola TaxID=2569538 RepID=A0A4U1BBC1_9GAMM|nr:exodeoxyribonuclease V subunit alpha [Ferrimonas sediminicola]TKB47319.1 exodeoxyribonuclease V subunit alpha [Ferrimonas sediminicola]
MSLNELMQQLKAYLAEGWLRPLDLALAKLLLEQQPDTPAQVVLAAVWTSHQLGRGHLCLELSLLLQRPGEVLALPPEGRKPAQLPHPGELMASWSEPGLIQALGASPLVASVEGEGCEPLVLSQGRLYLRRYYRYECQVAQQIHDRLRPLPVEPESTRTQLAQLFAPLKSADEARGDSVHWQSVAAALACRSRFTVISGGPGTGKTTTVVRLLAALQGPRLAQGEPLRIRLAAPTGKAAARLSESLSGALNQLPEGVRGSIPTQVTTLHRLLGSRPDSRHFRHHRGNPLHLDLLVVDEASMVDLEMMAALLQALPEHASLILLGDKDQLASVEAGAVLGDLCRNADEANYHDATLAYLARASGYDLAPWQGQGTALDQQIALLRKSHRFDANSGIGRLAAAVNIGDSRDVARLFGQPWPDLLSASLGGEQDRALERLCIEGDASPARTIDGGQPLGYRHYLERMRQGLDRLEQQAAQCSVPAQWLALVQAQQQWALDLHRAFGAFQLLCAVRDGEFGVAGLNRRIAQALKGAGLIERDQGWYPGRPVILTRNDYSLKLMNGDIGLCLPLYDELGQRSLRVAFPTPDGGLKSVQPSRLSDVDTVFAMTVHKSQGSEFAHTAMVLPAADSPILTRELLYTGITRAKTWFSLLLPRPQLVASATARRTVRASGLATRLGSLEVTP